MLKHVMDPRLADALLSLILTQNDIISDTDLSGRLEVPVTVVRQYLHQLEDAYPLLIRTEAVGYGTTRVILDAHKREGIRYFLENGGHTRRAGIIPEGTEDKKAFRSFEQDKPIIPVDRSRRVGKGSWQYKWIVWAFLVVALISLAVRILRSFA